MAALAVAALVGAGFVVWPRTPAPAAGRTGDPALLAAIEATAGLHRTSVAVIDPTGVRFAGVGADEHTAYEAGSISKAVTGLLIADAVERGELSLDDAAERHLPELAGTAVGTRTVRQLVTHTAGLPPLDARTRARGIGAALLARNPYAGVSRQDVLAGAAEVEPAAPGAYRYSNLGAALAGHAVAAAAGVGYPALVRMRLLQPTGLERTELQTVGPLVPKGYAASGRRQQPWVMTGYAPAGAVVSTTSDLARLATAVLAEEAPGTAALTPLAPAGDTPGRRIGIFWQQSELDGRTVDWHNGATGGYHAFLGLDRDRERAVVVLADVQTDVVDQLGMELLSR